MCQPFGSSFDTHEYTNVIMGLQLAGMPVIIDIIIIVSMGLQLHAKLAGESEQKAKYNRCCHLPCSAPYTHAQQADKWHKHLNISHAVPLKAARMCAVA